MFYSLDFKEFCLKTIEIKTELNQNKEKVDTNDVFQAVKNIFFKKINVQWTNSWPL